MTRESDKKVVFRRDKLSECMFAVDKKPCCSIRSILRYKQWILLWDFKTYNTSEGVHVIQLSFHSRRFFFFNSLTIPYHEFHHCLYSFLSTVSFPSSSFFLIIHSTHSLDCLSLDQESPREEPLLCYSHFKVRFLFMIFYFAILEIRVAIFFCIIQAKVEFMTFIYQKDLKYLTVLLQKDVCHIRQWFHRCVELRKVRLQEINSPSDIVDHVTVMVMNVLRTKQWLSVDV